MTSDPLELRYRILRRLLANNSELLEMLADLEADLCHFDPGEHRIRQPITRLLEGSLLLSENLNILTGHKFGALYDSLREIEQEVMDYLDSFPLPGRQPFMLPLHECSVVRIREVGGKAANLGELRLVMPERVPPGFVVTTAAYRHFLDENLLREPVRELLRDLSLITERGLFKERTAAIRELLEKSPAPVKVAEAIADGVMQFSLPWPSRWAVRSSAIGEDGRLSFAGQFDTILDVPTNELQQAYKKVIAGRYTDRAELYRLITGTAEVDTPMAVLFLPMIEAGAAGVLYTRDPRDDAADRMLINSVRGLADDLVRGHALADTFLVSREKPGLVLEQQLAGSGRSEEGAKLEKGAEPNAGEPSLSPSEIEVLVETGLRIEEHFGESQDIEWVLGRDGGLMIVQSRRLSVEDRRAHKAHPMESKPPLFEGGTTIFPGRAVGPAFPVRDVAELERAPEGSILVIKQATPELSAVLPVIAGVIVEHGNPSGHAATLVREFGVPGLFGVGAVMDRIKTGQSLSLDATHRRVFEGTLWPEVGERVRARIKQARPGRRKNPLHERILLLNLTDPLSLNFRAGQCRSVHDVIRFTHEKAVSAMFDLGDEAVRHGRRRAWRVESAVPLNLTVMDLGGSIGESAQKSRSVRPDQIESAPFQSLWKGITHPGLSWAGRRRVSAGGLASVMAASMTDARAPIRRLGDRNYLIVAPEYLNLNARLAYHFAMIDALVTDVAENNYVNFRFRGGGAGTRRRDLRSRFLEEVLLRSNFGVDRRGDLVTAWLRRYPGFVSGEGLALLGRLMCCARQLDMLMDGESKMRGFVARFMDGDYQAFA